MTTRTNGGGELKVSTCRRSKRWKKNREKRSAAARYLGEPETDNSHANALVQYSSSASNALVVEWYE